ncbi:DUF6207 family protein [Streptomyces coeruleorubidus]|uniref:DUF6207 family protein n=1 Tax=Streptomyces coeruleorubidus TaxID=116188 RepID=A0ABZ0KNC6_STRC4|nr:MULTISPECIES: DUF6207 family protein [Streptomyces]WOT39522.1 DUF6207 family protein [Streptomyces coeruleorubidus]
MKARQRWNSPRGPGRSAVHGPDQRDARQQASLDVVDVAAADDATALAFQQLLAKR